MASLLPHIAGALFDTPLLLAPGKVPAILAALDGRLGALDLSEIREPAEASRFVGDRRDGASGALLPYARTADGIAIVTLVGSWVNRGGWVGASSGLISYEGFRYQLQEVGADPKVRGVVLDMESPGGAAVGCFEVARAVRELAATKPVTALVNGMAASAAYAIASAATRVVTTETGLAGSIGVLLIHLDRSAALEKAGVRPTIIHAGSHKADGNPFEALPASVRADLQREIDGLMAMFVECVASGRQSLTPDAIRATEARIFMGREAVAAGLADDVGSLNDVLADLRARRLPARSTNTLPTTSTTRSAAVTDAERQEVRAEERARIAAITGSKEAKGREGPALTLALETDLTAEQAAKILAMSPSTQDAQAAAFIAEKEGRQTLNLDAESPPAGGKQAGADAWASAVEGLNASHGVKVIKHL